MKKSWIAYGLLIFTPLFGALFLCWKYGGSILEIDNLSYGISNDEMYYYKQIEAMVAYNKPMGFFGYNESSAAIGGYGAWSMVLFIPYYLFGKLLGWTYISPILCNFLMLTMAFALFAVIEKPRVKQSVYISLCYVACLVFSRYTLSMMIEPVCWALLIIFIAIANKLKDAMIRGKRYILLLAVVIFMADFMTLMRGYYALLCIVPIWFFIKFKKGWKTTCLLIANFFLSIIGYLLTSKLLCASYFASIVNLEWLKLLISHPAQGTLTVIGILGKSIREIALLIMDGLKTGSLFGCNYAFFLMLLCIILWKIIIDKKYEYVMLFTLSIVFLFSIIFLYSIYQGGRHICSAIIAMILVHSSVETKKGIDNVLALSVAIFLYLICGNNAGIYYVPLRDNVADARVYNLAAQLEENLEVVNETSWDNTIIWVLQDETGINWVNLYAVPKGMGINVCYKEYVLENWANIKSKYIWTNAGETIDQRCAEDGKKLVAEYENVHVWQLR